MRSLTLFFLSCALFAYSASAQDYTFETQFAFEPARFDEPPSIRSKAQPEFPDAARKNGVEGVVKVKFTLAGDGTIKNASIVEDLPFGMGEAVKNSVQRMSFRPARLNGTPIDMNATLTCTITVFYFEGDKDIQNVKLLEKPTAPYPESMRAEGHKGPVRVGVTFYANGKIKVTEAQSSMPPEFDAAAKKAALDLKFIPAMHKKSKKPVNQVLWVTFEFKP